MIAAHGDKIHLLLNNAGIGGGGGFVNAQDRADWEEHLMSVGMVSTMVAAPSSMRWLMPMSHISLTPAVSMVLGFPRAEHATQCLLFCKICRQGFGGS
ncbi:MAG: hypothetical protein ACNYPE_16095 [Candidatus Azotimanducaceae bacterium WSBS_2022_MAG_OTU7]